MARHRDFNDVNQLSGHQFGGRYGASGGDYEYERRTRNDITDPEEGYRGTAYGESNFGSGRDMSRDENWYRGDRTPGNSQHSQHRGRGPKGYRRSDDRIKEDVCEALTQHPHVDAHEVEVDVVNAEVTLRGTVEDRRMKREAEACVENCYGVKEVHNQIRLLNSPNASTTDGRSVH